MQQALHMLGLASELGLGADHGSKAWGQAGFQAVLQKAWDELGRAKKA